MNYKNYIQTYHEGMLLYGMKKHLASTLHYDLRLEFKGNLKSWWITPGSFLNPAIKHKAGMTENHAIKYLEHEGHIPEGRKGAGIMLHWDLGYYLPIGGTKNREDNEDILKEMLEKGIVQIELHALRLKGKFTIFKTYNTDWIFIKQDDEFSSAEDITKLNWSIEKRKTIENYQIEIVRKKEVEIMLDFK